MRRSSTVYAVAGLLAGVAVLSGAGASYAGVRAAVQIVGTADNKFQPADVTAALDASGKVTITFTAQGAPHTIQSDEIAGFDSKNVNAGETKTVTFAAQPGTYQFYCAYHKTAGMVGTLTVTGKGGGSSAPASATPTAAPTSAAASSAPPASASASATVGTEPNGAGAPTAAASEEAVPGLEGNSTLELLKSERAAQHGAVSGFRFFTMVAVAFTVILCAAVLFSTRPRRAGR